MQRPSLTSVTAATGRTLQRFPLAILLAIAGSSIMIYTVAAHVLADDDLQRKCWDGFISCYLGMLLSISTTVWAERRSWRRGRALVLQLLVLILTVVYYLSMPDPFAQKTVIRNILYGLGLHLLISVAAFSGRAQVNGFWQYNKRLFLRILISGLYTGVLLIGLVLALIAIKELFHANINNRWYAYMYIALIGVFNTWFFLAGVPREYDNPAVITDYPKGLKIFTQYVLLPILTLYLLILYAYLLKIVVTAHWPPGWVVYLVLAFSILGILALLLLYPIREEEGNKWINGYTRLFFFALLPLEVMLCVAIWKRMTAYGITEGRYFVVLLALWLIGITLYFLRSRIRNIQLIPQSLCLLAFLSSFGPWGAFGVSRLSQQNRIKKILEKNGMLSAGRVKAAAVKMPRADQHELSAATLYIVNVHGYQSLQPLFHENLDSLMKKDDLLGRYAERERATAILHLMRQTYVNEWDEDNNSEYFSADMDPDDGVFTSDGYTYIMPNISLMIIDRMEDSLSGKYKLGDMDLSLDLDSARNQIRFTCSERNKNAAILVDLSPLIADLSATTKNSLSLSPGKATLTFKGAGWKGKLIAAALSGRRENDKPRIERLTGYLFMGRDPGH